jgi:acetyl esterase/lipase
VNEPGENTGTSCVPDALILFSPVIDTSADGYGQAKVGPRWQELSPAHRVRPGMPPTLLCHGTADATTPFKGAVDFDQAMRAAGNRCELVAVKGEQHTYMMKDAALYARTQAQTRTFLLSTGILLPVKAGP